jgi:hypothetical protein
MAGESIKIVGLPTQLSVSEERGGRKERMMLIIGCDYHPSFQRIAFVDEDASECGDWRLEHIQDAAQFYHDPRPTCSNLTRSEAKPIVQNGHCASGS